MGLDVRFYPDATPVVHSAAYPFDDECWDYHTVAYVSDFPDQADGIANKSCWVHEADPIHLSQTYNNYSGYRAWLCMAMYGVEPQVAWENADDYRGQPFFEQINFSDAEGTIGPKTAMKLAKDYAEQRERVVGRGEAMPKPFDMSQGDHERGIKYFVEKYDEWAAAFASVGETGMVVFS